MITSALIKKKAAQLGADLCGISTISRFGNAPEGFHPTDIFPGCKSVIVFASRFPLSTLNMKSNSPYTLVRNVLVNKLDAISFDLAYYLEREGCTSVPIPSAEPYDYWDAENRHGRGILSLKHAGRLAGLGEIGKNTLLINDQYGNMIWLGAVLTSMEMEADKVLQEKYCPSGCTICLDACPQKALDGVTIDQKACRKRCLTCTDGGGWILACNICRQVCPKYRGKKQTPN
jgi:epoxyqueuosine reductase